MAICTFLMPQAALRTARKAGILHRRRRGSERPWRRVWSAAVLSPSCSRISPCQDGLMGGDTNHELDLPRASRHLEVPQAPELLGASEGHPLRNVLADLRTCSTTIRFMPVVINAPINQILAQHVENDRRKIEICPLLSSSRAGEPLGANAPPNPNRSQAPSNGVQCVCSKGCSPSLLTVDSFVRTLGGIE
jgi:hypothetical protein